jgi:predicted acyltransferase
VSKGENFAELLRGMAVLVVYWVVLYWMYLRKLFLKI